MSEGITAYDFVQQVYYMQEKTLLDFWPTDDKFREVLTEANLVLRELESQQDWTWLRETLVLGDTLSAYNEIVEFTLPNDVYKLSMLNHDSIRLYNGIDNGDGTYDIDEFSVVHVPLASAGDQRWNREQQVNQIGVNHVHDYRLRAVIHGHTIKMNRTLLPWEGHCVAVVDVQKHIVPFHVCKYNHTRITGTYADQACTQDATNVGGTLTPNKYLKEILKIKSMLQSVDFSFIEKLKIM